MLNWSINENRTGVQADMLSVLLPVAHTARENVCTLASVEISSLDNSYNIN